HGGGQDIVGPADGPPLIVEGERIQAATAVEGHRLPEVVQGRGDAAAADEETVVAGSAVDFDLGVLRRAQDVDVGAGVARVHYQILQAAELDERGAVKEDRVRADGVDAPRPAARVAEDEPVAGEQVAATVDGHRPLDAAQRRGGAAAAEGDRVGAVAGINRDR